MTASRKKAPAGSARTATGAARDAAGASALNTGEAAAANAVTPGSAPAATAVPPGEAAAAAAVTPGHVLRHFRIVFNAVKSHFRDLERRTGVGGAQAWALSVVAATPGIGIKGLAAAMDIRQSTASNLVRALIERGLVLPRRGTRDRRTIRLEILPAGKAVLARAPGPFSGVLPAALRRLDTDTLARLDHDLKLLIGLLEADATAAQSLLAQL